MLPSYLTKTPLRTDRISAILSPRRRRFLAKVARGGKTVNGAERIIQKFGGNSALARALGKGPSTVRYWAQTGRIPAKRQGDILALAKEKGIALRPVDFVHVPEPDTDSVQDGEPSVPIARWPGALKIGTVELPVYVLDDGLRVISRTGATDVITGRKGGGNLESYLGVGALVGYIPEDWHEHMIEFVIPGVQNKTVRGITAETFLDICRAYVRALDDGALVTNRQKDIAAKASMFLAACAKVGLVALIDEATGYQYERAEDALQFKLRLFLEEEMRKWEATFPDELWREFGRLTNWGGKINQRPKYWGKLVMELVYEYLDPDVAEWLKEHNPKPQKGQNHHQWLSSQYGLRRLVEHIWMVIGLAKACHTMSELKARMAELYGRQPVQLTMFLPPPNSEARPAYPPYSALPRSPGTKNGRS
jgi:hypothetical protein